MEGTNTNNPTMRRFSNRSGRRRGKKLGHGGAGGGIGGFRRAVVVGVGKEARGRSQAADEAENGTGGYVNMNHGNFSEVLQKCGFRADFGRAETQSTTAGSASSSSSHDASPPHTGFRCDYALGDPVRHVGHMRVAPTPWEALHSAVTLRTHDYAFVKRSHGRYTYAVLAIRDEESMTFVLDGEGNTKVLGRQRWAEFLCLVEPEEDESETMVAAEDADDDALPPLEDASIGSMELYHMEPEEDDDAEGERFEDCTWIPSEIALTAHERYNDDDDDIDVAIHIPRDARGDKRNVEADFGDSCSDISDVSSHKRKEGRLRAKARACVADCRRKKRETERVGWMPWKKYTSRLPYGAAEI